MNVSFKTQFSLFGETSVGNLIAVKQDLYLSLNLFSAMRVMSYALFSTIKVTVYNCNVLFYIHACTPYLLIRKSTMSHQSVSIGLVMKLSYVIVNSLEKDMLSKFFFPNFGTIDIHIWDTTIKNGAIVLVFTHLARNSQRFFPSYVQNVGNLNSYQKFLSHNKSYGSY